MVIQSRIPAIPYYEGDLPSAMWEAMDRYTDRIAIVDTETRYSWTYGRLQAAAESLASHLLSLGVKRGDVVTVYGTNCPEYAVAVCAIWRVGGALCCLNAMAVANDVRREIRRTKCSVLFSSAANVHNAIAGTTDTNLHAIISFSPHPGCLSLPDLISRPAPGVSLPSIASLQIDPVKDTGVILYSSGTTGLPKAVQLPHRNINMLNAALSSPEFSFTAKDAILVFVPMAHIFGVTLLSIGLTIGATLFLMPKFDLSRYLELILEYKIGVIHLVPPVAVMMAKSGFLKAHDMSCVKEIVCGAAPLSPDVEAEINEQMGGHVHFRQAYGLTEVTGVMVHTPTPNYRHLCLPTKPGTVGIVLPPFNIKFVDTETGKEVGVNTEGELCVKSPVLMTGYLGDAGSTAATIDESGWLHTGDIGYYDQNECIYIVDRLKELIKYNGLQVAPSELEAHLLTHPAVADVAVVGRPDPVAGELPLAWVVLKPDQRATEADLQKYVADNVAPYKRLRGGVQFVEAIPKSPSGKILRKDIRLAIKSEMNKAKL